MKEQSFILPAGVRNLTRLIQFLSAASKDMALKITVSEWRRTRSNEQNAYLWGVVYKSILQHLPGWDADDLHEFCLGEWAGWETLEGFGRKRLRPLRRSARLTTVEFMDFIAFIQRTMAERGIYVPDPNERVAA